MSMGDVMAVCPLCGEMYYHVNGHNCKQPNPAHVMPSLDSTYSLILANLHALETVNKNLEDRVAVLEDLTCDHESRLEDLEKKADDD